MTRFFFIALLAVSACAPVYVPNVRNSPMFTKGGEFQASIQFGNGIEAQSAFAITEHFGVMVNYAFIDRNSFNPDKPDNYLRHKFFEGGAGYFVNNEDSFFEVFAGFGKGKGSSYATYQFFGAQSDLATGRYDRFFLQPAFGLNKKVMNISFAPRFSLVDFYEFSNETSSYPIDEKATFLFEPAVIGRVNFANNHMFFTFQTGASLGMSTDVYFDRRTFQLSMGLGLRLGGARELVNRL